MDDVTAPATYIANRRLDTAGFEGHDSIHLTSVVVYHGALILQIVGWLADEVVSDLVPPSTIFDWDVRCQRDRRLCKLIGGGYSTLGRMWVLSAAFEVDADEHSFHLKHASLGPAEFVVTV